MEPKDFSAITSRLADPDGDGSSAQHLNTLRAVIEAIERGDLDTVFRCAHPDVTLDIFAPQEFGWIRHAKGAGQVRRAIEHNFSAVVDQRPTLASLSAQGDTVVLFGREVGKIRGSGAPYDVEFVQRFTFAEGQLASVRIIVAHTSVK